MFSDEGKFLFEAARPESSATKIATGIAFAANGEAFVSYRSLDCVAVYRSDGSIVNRVTSDSGLREPVTIAVHKDSGLQELLFIVDKGVQVRTLEGAFVRGWGRIGKEDGEFQKARGIAVNSRGEVAVSDYVYDADIQVCDVPRLPEIVIRCSTRTANLCASSLVRPVLTDF